MWTIALILTTLTPFQLDSTLTFSISNRLSSPAADMIFKALTISGDRNTLLLYSAVFTAFAPEKDIKYLKQAIIGGFLTAGVVGGLKFLTARTRPDGSDDRFNSSFPSGHAALSSFTAFYFGTRYPKYKVPLILWSFLVGLSRIYLKRHYLSDVIVGWTLGYAGARFVIYYYDNHGS